MNLNSNFKEILDRIDVKLLLKYGLYMFLALLCQNMLFTQFRILGVCPMVLPAVAVAVGMIEGSSWGALFGLIMGVFADMAYVESTITFTVLFPALAFAAGFMTHFFVNQHFLPFMGVAFVGLLVTAIVQMLGTFAVDGWSGAMLPTVLLQTLWSLPPAVLAYFPPAKWIRR